MEMYMRKSGTGERAAYSLGSNLSRIEVWPFFGFNCIRWDCCFAGEWRPVLYRTADFDTNPKPTRNGHPILFPFPNRLRFGRFTFAGREYQLPLTDNTGQHAIHGFTPRNSWRVIDASFDDKQAWITGEFCLSKDLPQWRDCWPADARIRVTYRLFTNSLRVEAVIDAADNKPMPFGLGYHPYFTLSGKVDNWMLQTQTGCLWESIANFPTGEKLPVTSELDFSQVKQIGSLALDHLYGDLRGQNIAILSTSACKLTISVDSVFRELLLFTPPHRQALAIEPYTCITDAVNLSDEEHDTGWQVLLAGETFTAAVEYHYAIVR